MRRLINLSLGICLFVLAYGCQGQQKKAEKRVITSDTIIKGNFTPSATMLFDSTAVDSFLIAQPEFSRFAGDLKAFYRLHKFHYVWYDGTGLTEAAHNLINHLETQQTDGILKTVPYKDAFLKLVSNTQVEDQLKPKTLLELMLTAQYFNYAHNKWGGAEVDKTATMGWYLPKKKLSYTELLQKQFSTSVDSVEQVAVVPQYIALRNALNKYQELDKREKDVVVPFSVGLNKIKPGDTAAIILLLKDRLRQLGDLKDQPLTTLYDDTLKQAVLQFKERHGLTGNAILNAAFFKQLNIPLKQRMEAMIVNLERMRWIPVDDHGGEYLLVNIPEYKLHYYTDNQLVWDCKVVVGKVMSKTVVFSGHMQYIVFSPYWYVPQSIINKEIKPGIKRNANYLANHRMEWNGGNVRQKPGGENSLGLVKFIFPNSNNIYLHDTPAKPLFNEENRAFSHGCIRVEQPRELAIRILKQNPAWTPEKIDAAMNAGTERTVILTHQIPVYIGYFTAFVSSKGVLNFRNDVYNRDEKLLDLLMK